MGDGEADEPVEEAARIRTFLIADVRGYTVFTQERGDEAAAKLAARFAVIARAAVDEQGGSVIELRGDEALAVFDSARQAIRAATLLQQRFLEETEADPTLPLPVGIGLDAGEAVPVERGYRGGALNLAARLCGRAGPGEILASQSVAQLARKVEGIRAVDRGELHLKGLEEPVRVFRMISEDGDPAERFRQLAPAQPARTAAPLRLARRHPAVAILVALALVAAIAIPATFAVRGGTGDLIAGDALAMIDLGTGKLAGSVPLDSRPGDVAVGAGGVWVTLPDRGAVMRIDPQTLTIRNSIPVGADPSGIAIGGDSVWVTNGGSSTVSRISSATEAVVKTIPSPGGPTGIAVGQGGVWVANSLSASVSHIDPESGELLATIPVGDAPVDVALDDRGLWVANSVSGTVSRIDTTSDLEVGSIPVGNGPDAIVAGPDGVWAANFLSGTVAHIDQDTSAVDQAVRVGTAPTGLALAGGSVWVSDGSDGSVASIEPGAQTATSIQLGSQANDVALGDGVLWVTVRARETSHRGGTLTVWAPSPYFDSADPALAYTALTWNLLSLTGDGLVAVRRTGGLAGTTLVPDLARSLPQSTDGGRTYTFQLRPDVRYSTGEPVRPEDFRRAIERVFANLDAGGYASSGVPYFSDIVGAQACSQTPGEPCDLSGGIIADDEAGTVTFHLRAPDPDLLYALTMPFAFAVPAGSPDALADGETFPATGPYVIDRYEPGKEVVLIRNPEFKTWSEAARPDGFPDQIVWRLGSDPAAMVADTLKGEADMVFAPPPDQIADLASSHAGQLQLTPRPNTTYMDLDTRVPPFDDVRVRQALNFAVDRGVVETLSGGDFGASCQILPPNLPGYSPYCPYTRHPGGAWTAPDLAKAHELVARSGTAGTKVTVWASEDANPISVPIGRYFRDLLEGLGYRASLRVVGFNAWSSALNGRPRRAQITLVSWTADYVAESGFIIPLLACDGVANTMGFCDPAIDRRMEGATQLRATDPAGASDLWSKIEHDLVDQAPIVPLGTRYWVNLLSQRVGNYQSAPQWGPLVDQMWVR